MGENNCCCIWMEDLRISLNRFCFKGFVALTFAFTHGELQVAIRVEYSTPMVLEED